MENQKIPSDAGSAAASFIGLEPYPHQKEIIKRMIYIEDFRKIISDLSFPDVSREPLEMETSAMVLSEPFGSGKTIELLGLILERPIPKMRESVVRIAQNTSIGSFYHEITVDLADTRIIRPTLIIVNPNVLSQWEDTIRNHTRLRLLVVENIKSMDLFRRSFEEDLSRGGENNRVDILPNVDVILLKYCKLSARARGPPVNGVSSEMYAHKNTMGVISEITKNHYWGRVIYDDFDMLRLSPTNNKIKTLFTIYVSATRKNTNTNIPPVRTYDNIYEALDSLEQRATAAFKDDQLFRLFNVKNDNKFIIASIQPKILYKRVHVLENPNDRYIKLIYDVLPVLKKDIIEMLNGDAPDKAAEMIGVNCTSIPNIFYSLLGKNYKKYTKNAHILRNVEAIMEDFRTLPDTQYTKEEISRARSDLPDDAAKMNGFSPEMEKMLQSTAEKCKKIIYKTGLSLERVVSNIKEGYCQICYSEIGSSSVFILKCCGFIVCSECCRCNQFSSDNFKGKCANCRSIITVRDLIFADESLDLRALADIKMLEMTARNFPPVSGKLAALMKIINGEDVGQSSRAEYNQDQILCGSMDIPYDFTRDGPRKFVIFSVGRTLEMVENHLSAIGISFLVLRGGVKNKRDTIDKFKVEVNILLINSRKICAGVDLEFASDLIFMHKIIDVDVESQIIGRIQRINRKYNGTVHYLFYRNEMEY